MPKHSALKHSSEALANVFNAASISKSKNYSDKCRYCIKTHWSDACPENKNIKERKNILKDLCYKCSKVGHKSTDCLRSKVCEHCKANNENHRSLCPKKFPMTINAICPTRYPTCQLLYIAPLTSQGNINKKRKISKRKEEK